MTDPFGLHVLLVEDNPDERWLLGEILRGRGHTVTACEDGESAWSAFRNTHPRLIILDWVLPGLDGLELCRLIREEKNGPGCVILVVTSRDSAEDLRMVLDAGADDYVPKPLNVSLFEIRLAVAEQRVRNIRERERTRLALEAKTRELEALFQNLDEVFFSIDLALGELIQVSPAVEHLLGVSPGALMRDREAWRELLLPPELRESTDLAATLTSIHNLTFEYEAVRHDGEARWVEANLKTGASPEGQVIRLDGILSDRTARRVVEEELSARNQELLTLHRVGEIILRSTDPPTAFRDVLAEVTQATSFPAGLLARLDFSGKALVITESVGIKLPGDGPHEITLTESPSGVAVDRKKPVAVEDAGSHPDFSRGFLARHGIRSCVAFPLVASGRVQGVLILADREVREIPLRLLRWGESLANSLALFVERLEAEAALKSGEQKALSLAGELQAANQELEAFAYSVSHDLRAPLRTMQGFAHSLLQEHGEAIPAEARDFVRRIIASGHRSEELIRDLLAYSRMSSEELELQELDVAQAVTDAREQVAADLEARGARLRLPERFPTVVGHHTTLIQILANLLSNAVRFVPDDRTPEVVLRWEDVPEGDRVRFWVEDNGPGIPLEHQERIFKVFERLEGEIQRPGTGIGLAIVRRGAQRMDGDVGVVSDGSSGSRFWLELPKGRPQGWRPWGRRWNNQR